MSTEGPPPSPEADEQIPFWHRSWWKLKEEAPAPSERVLGPNEQVLVDTEAPFTDASGLWERLRIHDKPVARVDAGDKAFLIVDSRDPKGGRDLFTLVDETFTPGQIKGCKAIRKNQAIVLGRHHYPDRFTYSGQVSKDHFEVIYADNGLSIQNLNPKNQTVVTANLISDKQDSYPAPVKIEANRTVLAVDRVQGRPEFRDNDTTAPYGYYLNHPILGRRSTSVKNGVYLGGSAREAIVVDDETEELHQAYEEVVSSLQKSVLGWKVTSTRAILLRVMRQVQKVLPYDSDKTEQISRQHGGDKLVPLSVFAQSRAGVCRHQALLAASIIERLVEDGSLGGTVGVERNTVKEMGGTHAWAVYKPSPNEDETIVVDPAQTFVGTKSKARRSGRWEYQLPSDNYGTDAD